jgi:hypothetical protein
MHVLLTLAIPFKDANLALFLATITMPALPMDVMMLLDAGVHL